ncbi:MAG: 4Fe-4S dicluster domain-containing protein [Metallosphaera sp.]
MEGTIFSAISRTKLVSKPKEVIHVRGTQDLMNGGTPRYEYFRGEEGERVLDFTDFKGVQDLGDKLKVLPGTPWKDLLNYNVEVYGLEDASVGGSVHFEDAGFGFNEFGSIRKRVEVEAVIDGNTYTGFYKGGLISSVFIRKEFKPILFMKLERSFNFVINRVKLLYSGGIPPFRDVTLHKIGDLASLYVSFPETRKTLLEDKIKDMSESGPYSFKMGNYKYRYFGSINTLEVDERAFSNVEELIMFIRKDSIKFVALSNTPLSFPYSLEPYSDSNSKELFSGCILCGKCVYVCPHVEQRDDKNYSPLGFFISLALNNQTDYANCHFCGKCENVCPVSLNIVDNLKQKAKNSEVSMSLSIDLPSKKAIVITPISQSLLNEALRVIKYFNSLGVKLGLITLNVPLSSLLKGSKVEISNIIEEIYVLTPEEQYFLLQSKPKNVVDVYFVFDLLPVEKRNLILSKEIHKPCFYKSNIKGNNKCSFALLEMANNERSANPKAKGEISVCPLAAKKLNIASYVDVLDDVDKNDTNKLVLELNDLINGNELLIQDLSWYEGLDDNIKIDFITRLIDSFIKDKDPASLVLAYVEASRNNLINDEKTKRVFLERIRNSLAS